MSDPITNRVAAIMAASDEVYIPIHYLYQQLTAEGLMVWTDLPTFQWLLSNDERFEVLQEEFEEPLELMSDLEAELEALGIFPGVQVKLRARQASETEVMRGFLRHLRHINYVLEELWRWRSEADDPEGEADLIQLLMFSDMVEREIARVLSEHSDLLSAVEKRAETPPADERTKWSEIN